MLELGGTKPELHFLTEGLKVQKLILMLQTQLLRLKLAPGFNLVGA